MGIYLVLVAHICAYISGVPGSTTDNKGVLAAGCQEQVFSSLLHTTDFKGPLCSDSPSKITWSFPYHSPPRTLYLNFTGQPTSMGNVSL